jgi:hypothetical protein
MRADTSHLFANKVLRFNSSGYFHHCSNIMGPDTCSIFKGFCVMISTLNVFRGESRLRYDCRPSYAAKEAATIRKIVKENCAQKSASFSLILRPGMTRPLLLIGACCWGSSIRSQWSGRIGGAASRVLPEMARGFGVRCMASSVLVKKI